MDLFATNRSKIADRPALLGRGCVVPHIYVFPSEDGASAELTAFLPVGHNEFTDFHRTIPLAELKLFFDLYRDDPEETLQAYFGWLVLRPVPPKAMAMLKPRTRHTHDTETQALLNIL